MTGGLNILGATVNINQRPQSTLSGNIFIYPVKKLINIYRINCVEFTAIFFNCKEFLEQIAHSMIRI